MSLRFALYLHCIQSCYLFTHVFTCSNYGIVIAWNTTLLMRCRMELDIMMMFTVKTPKPVLCDAHLKIIHRSNEYPCCPYDVTIPFNEFLHYTQGVAFLFMRLSELRAMLRSYRFLLQNFVCQRKGKDVDKADKWIT